jgi:hypothetical protein
MAQGIICGRISKEDARVIRDLMNGRFEGMWMSTIPISKDKMPDVMQGTR